MPPEKKHLFDQPRNVHRLIWVFFALCALLLGLDCSSIGTLLCRGCLPS